MLIDLVVYDGVDELDVVGPLEVLRRANEAGAGFDVRIVAREPVEMVTGAVGLKFCPDAVFDTAAEIVVVPGGGWAARADRGAWHEARQGDLLGLLAGAAREGVIMAGVCTGTMLLAHAGVVGARRASTHHSAHADLAALGATVMPDRVTDDGDLITSGGVTSGLDLACWLVERFASRDLADTVARAIEYPRFRPAQS
jgi:transcriptional regulator GlxA family with amidase domain